MANNTEKAKKLYEACEVNPQENTLFPAKYFEDRKGGFFHAMVVGSLVSHYTQSDFEDDWIPLNRKTFHIGKQDNQGWTDVKNVIQKLTKKNLVETTLKDSQNYIRLSTDAFYDPEVYRVDN